MKKRFFAGIVGLVLLLAFTSVTFAECSFTGEWDTEWGLMTLSQSGSRVTGSYTHMNGRISGTVKGNKLVGNWYQSRSPGGEFIFTMNKDCDKFYGKWRYRNFGPWAPDSWDGTRIE